MIERRKGHIINMSSMAGYIATPTYTVYAASKFAVRGFSEALRREVGIYGIRVSGIYPGGVATDFGDIAGINRTTEITTPDFMTISAEDIAQVVWRLVRRPRRSIVMPGIMRLAIWLNALAQGLLDWMIARIFVIPERSL
jgi:short-subunit dehydrogenase